MKITLHVPYTQHDEFVVEANNADEAIDKLVEHFGGGMNHPDVRLVSEAVSEVTNFSYDPHDSSCFDEDGNELTDDEGRG